LSQKFIFVHGKQPGNFASYVVLLPGSIIFNKLKEGLLCCALRGESTEVVMASSCYEIISESVGEKFLLFFNGENS
jgi:hypothetical protein